MVLATNAKPQGPIPKDTSFLGSTPGDIGKHRLAVLSKNKELPKWGFGGAARFKYAKKQSPRSQSASVSHVNTSTISTTGASGIYDDGLIEDGELSDDGDGLESGTIRPTNWTGGWSVGGFVPRLDGSSDRSADLPARASCPKAKQYDPAVTMGEDANLSFWHSPNFSLGGGKSRMADMEPKALALKKAASTKTMRKSSSDTSAAQELARLKAKNKGLSRGFGTEVRLRYKGGSMELPISPGPCAYDVPRNLDLPPQWAPSTTVPWGKRSAGRPALRFPTASDVGPGEYTAHHNFTTFARPHPLFGHPLRELTKDETPEPGRYDVPTCVGDAPAFSMGTGNRPPLVRIDLDKPGPGAHDPDLRSMCPDSTCAVFGKSERVHESDLIDPDEPPGPGAHRVKLLDSIPNPGLPKEEKLKKTPGLGPQGPGPGQYPGANASTFGKKASGMHSPLDRPIDNFPGPTDYDPVHTLVHQAGPAASSPQFKEPRRPPWEGPGWGKDEDPNRPTMKPKEDVFKPSGPKWVMAPRRGLPPGLGPPKDSENHHAMVGAFGSVTPRGSKSTAASRTMRGTMRSAAPSS